MRLTPHSLAALALLAIAPLACGVPDPPNDPVTRADRADGQWVWSAADAARFAESRRADRALLPGVWVATIAFAGDSVTQRLARSPAAARDTGGAPVVAVVRFDDAFHRAWDVMDDRALAAALGARLGRLLAALDASDARVAEVQLDYDCPERRLARWAAVVRALGRGPLAGRPLWITSIPAHVRHADYGTLFRGAVAGHVVQVFDTGDRFDAAALGTLAAALDARALPFRLGVGAFERATRRGPTAARTSHRAWFAAAPRLARSRWYRGTWVFPAGERWLDYRVASSETAP
ncbi:Protein of unknown function DUF3142 (plasmid) [Gemmatirosa kalamazoonensis]|uniref:DUF3142 domain-containing protein n=1 Tax=Gemmatirosa kalamazoonensis TaxID=861299 RepID=W0RSI1_9BACT|nr:hypothetical protein [Gemmatirosa kalamazoonensis]AHG92548.1 Protein of unknown function DUF3142 [Gemmatirosa kalamazoonensis]